MKLKLSDYIAKFIAKQGIKHVWAITGGASIHMIHSCAKHPDIEVICPHHEQAGAMAADGYSRVTGNLGVAVCTSGPGATNMITGIAGAYFDSIPVLYLTGQVVRDRMKSTTGVRQMGFQETDIISMVRSITKYSAQVHRASDIRVELEKAVYIAKSGRPGPVLLDIPDDLQREMVETDSLHMYTYGNTLTANNRSPLPEEGDLRKCLGLLKDAKRPVLILGWGIRLSKTPFIRKFIETLDIPVCPSWGAMDTLPTDHPLKVGGIGINGSRAGNFTIQNADFILAVGARLSTRETGNPLRSFAREAKIAMVDIDRSELRKFAHFGKKIDLPIHADAKIFMLDLMNRIKHEKPYSCPKEWKDKINEWKAKYDQRDIVQSHQPIDPYFFIDRLSYQMNEKDILISDTGCGLPWLMQGFKFKEGQRLFHDFNNTAMGYAIPASIGAYFAAQNRRIVCVVGDGSFLMNIQELATIQHHNIPIKIFLLNNSGYSMVRQTEMEWLNNENMGTGEEALSFPDYKHIAKSFNFEYREIEKNYRVDEGIKSTIQNTKPSLCNVVIPKDAKVWPKLVHGRPIEDMHPLLPRDEFKSNMIVKPWEGWDK